MTTKIILTALAFWIYGFYLGVNRQVDFVLPPAFECEGGCLEYYRYNTTYPEAFDLTMAALKFQMLK